MRVLVTYATKNGSTQEIADAIADELMAHGLDVVCASAADADAADFDAVVLGSGVYAGRWLRPARRFLKANADHLHRLPFWVFSSGPTGDPSEDDPAWEEPKRTIARAEKLGARDHVVFGGRISPEGGRLERAMAEKVPEEYRDRRDWDEIRGWAAAIAAELEGGGSAA